MTINYHNFNLGFMHNSPRTNVIIVNIDLLVLCSFRTVRLLRVYMYVDWAIGNATTENVTMS